MEEPKLEQDHKERHILLHEHLDELFADYIQHHPKQVKFISMPVKDLMGWSHQQTLNPTTAEGKAFNKEVFKKNRQDNKESVKRTLIYYFNLIADQTGPYQKGITLSDEHTAEIGDIIETIYNDLGNN